MSRDTTPLPTASPGRRPRRLRRLRWGAALAVLLAGLGWATASAFREVPTAERSLTAPVERRDIEDTIAATGRILPKASVDVGAQVSGLLKTLHVAVGDTVEAGALLAEIDAEVQAATVEAIRADSARLTAELAEQRAALAYAEKHHARMAALAGTRSAPQAQLEESLRDRDMVRARLRALDAALRQTEARLKAEETTLGHARLHAPMSGTVVAVDVKQGQTLNANYETPVVLRLADLATMTVWAEVSEADVTRLRPGMPVWFTTLGEPERRWDGALRQILPVPAGGTGEDGDASAAERAAARSQVVLYTALFDVANPEGALRAGMTAQVRFVAARARDALTVPLAALETPAGTPGATSAMVRVLTAAGTVEDRTVTTGIRTRFLAEVRDGLVEGERVITGTRPDAGPSLVRFEP